MDLHEISRLESADANLPEQTIRGVQEHVYDYLHHNGILKSSRNRKVTDSDPSVRFPEMQHFEDWQGMHMSENASWSIPIVFL